jgi:NitT/TauT family transport system substrate-binding protein
MTTQSTLTRRRYLAASGAGVLALGLGSTRGVAAPETIRQGYQTNIWGMPTYYLMKSGYLEKHNLAAEEFAVPSGNLTMQQMVARQVDLGTYAGQSFIIGSAKGGLIAIALIEHVGKTARVTTRKDLNITKVEELRGLKIANQTGSSVGNVFVDTIMPQHGLKKGDYQEVRMDVNNMVAALAAKTVDAMVNVEPYTVIAYLKAWLDVAQDFKNNPKKVADVIYGFYADKGYKISLDVFATALSRVEVSPGFPGDLKPYMQEQAEILLKDKKIDAIPDWTKALRPDFMERARSGA